MSAAGRVLVLALIALLAAGAAVTLGGERPAVEAASFPSAGGIALTPLPPADAGAGAALLARSPFAPDRSAYARASAPVIEQSPPEIRLVAVITVAGERRATLLIEGMETIVGVGDVTPAGVVAAIEGDGVVFAGAESRRLTFFEGR